MSSTELILNLLIVIGLSASIGVMIGMLLEKGDWMTKKKELEDQLDGYKTELSLRALEIERLKEAVLRLQIDNANLKINNCKLATACYRLSLDLGDFAHMYGPEENKGVK
jgi:hypothetical protein